MPHRWFSMGTNLSQESVPKMAQDFLGKPGPTGKKKSETFSPGFQMDLRLSLWSAVFEP